MSEKFTPGPWKVWPSEHELNICGPGPREGYYAYIARLKKGDVEEANAHLIASAPDLYEALERLRSQIIGWGDDDQIEAIADEMKAASAALAKARGETK